MKRQHTVILLTKLTILFSVESWPTTGMFYSLSCSTVIPFLTVWERSHNKTLFHPCMAVIPLVPSHSPTLISSLLRLSTHHLALAASASQPLKSGTPLYLSIPAPVLIPSVVTSRPTTASRPSNPLCTFINYILYLLTCNVSQLIFEDWAHQRLLCLATIDYYPPEYVPQTRHELVLSNVSDLWKEI